MTAPVRLQLSRRKGFNLQEHSLATNGLPAVIVTRPGPWGNPWSIHPPERGRGWQVYGPGAPIFGVACGNEEGARLLAVKAFRIKCEGEPAEALSPLRSKNLACWCKPGAPCHADLLLELANRPLSIGADNE